MKRLLYCLTILLLLFTACKRYSKYEGVAFTEKEPRDWENPEVFKKFLDKNIYSCKDHFEYIEKNGGMHKLLRLREKEFMFSKARD